jgi:hypothetical protein
VAWAVTFTLIHLSLISHFSGLGLHNTLFNTSPISHFGGFVVLLLQRCFNFPFLQYTPKYHQLYTVKDVGMLNEASPEFARPIIRPCCPSVHPSRGVGQQGGQQGGVAGGDGAGGGKLDGVKNGVGMGRTGARGGDQRLFEITHLCIMHRAHTSPFIFNISHFQLFGER